ncbi:hypothetical protein [Treponema phagedenis]|uniref:hypothetical protein n=1 Tax=Treponema phagedenis TaxID=162 RepID=UPI0001F63D89|nr:hypothetical protein [Treponema phagedenis]EFW38455.1 hypothetical protein HMPREF9554_01038 [Treponema phagedenis F0421]TYT79029.1 hypothetical protein FS559_07865 [Treponema phagedenis]
MNNTVKSFLPIFILSFAASFSLFLLIFIPLSKQTTLWNGWRMVILPSGAKLSPIMENFSKQKIFGTANKYAIWKRFAELEVTDYQRYPFTDKNRYEQWFVNENEGLQYLYIPEQKGLSRHLYKALRTAGTPFYFEEGFAYSFFQGLLASVLFLFCYIKTKRRLFFFFTGIVFVVYAFCIKGIIPFAAALLMIYGAAYWAAALGGPLQVSYEQIIRRVKCNIQLIIIPCVTIIFSFLGGKKEFFLFFLALISSFSFAVLAERFLSIFKEARDSTRLHPSIKPYVMHPDYTDTFWSLKDILSTSFLTGVLLLFGVCSLYFISNNSLQLRKGAVSVPSPRYTNFVQGFSLTGYEEFTQKKQNVGLPDLSDFIADAWYKDALPFLPVHTELPIIQKDAKIVYNEFSEAPDGTLLETERIILEFNTAFIQELLASDKMSELEKMLYASGRFVSAGYEVFYPPFADSYKKFHLFAAFFVLLLPLFTVLLRITR